MMITNIAYSYFHQTSTGLYYAIVRYNNVILSGFLLALLFFAIVISPQAWLYSSYWLLYWCFLNGISVIVVWWYYFFLK